MLESKLNGINGAGKFAKVSAEDYPVVARHSWYYREGYAIAQVDGREVRMHRFIMKPELDATMYSDQYVVDHKDRDRLNNTRENLRLLSHVQNANNREDNVFVECFGESKTVAQWSRDERCTVPYAVLRGRLRKGIAAWEAILAPADAE